MARPYRELSALLDLNGKLSRAHVCGTVPVAGPSSPACGWVMRACGGVGPGTEHHLPASLGKVAAGADGSAPAVGSERGKGLKAPGQFCGWRPRAARARAAAPGAALRGARAPGCSAERRAMQLWPAANREALSPAEETGEVLSLKK